MNKVLQIERKFHELKRELQQRPSTRWSLRLINDFIALLDGDFETYQSYLLELVSRLPRLEDPLDFTGVDPSKYHRLLHHLRDIEQQVPEVASLKPFGVFKKDLQQRLALQYAFVGEPLKSLEVLDCKVRKVLEAEVEDWQKRVEETPCELLKKCTDKLREVNAECARKLENLQHLWIACSQSQGISSDIPKHRENSVMVPTVVQNEQDPEKKIGRLRRLSVELFDRSADGMDRITTNFDVDSGEKNQQAFRTRVAESVRQMLRKYHPKSAEKGLLGRLSYTNPGWYSQGHSMELASAGLMYGAVLSHAGLRKRYKIRSTAAITGRVSREGKVEKIDRKSLEAKVHAAFFSWVEVMVVPNQHRNEALDFKARLESRYPNRNLKIFGVEQLEGLFYDRRVSIFLEENLLRHYGKKVWEHKYSAVGIILILALSLITFRLFYGPIDRNPVMAELNNEYFYVQNAAGQQLARLPAGSDTEEDTNTRAHMQAEDLIQLYDVDGDSINEVFWFEQTSKDSLHATWLHARDIAAGEPLWSRPLEYRFSFPRKRDPLKNRYDGMEIELYRSPTTDSSHMLVLSHHESYFPGVVERVDPLTGENRGRYLNMGYLRAMELIDLDQNGKKELLVTGESNSLDQAILAVLDPAHFGGHSPLSDAYQVDSLHKETEIAYIAVSRTVVGRTLKSRMKASYGSNITNVEPKDQFQLSIHAGYRDMNLKNYMKTGFMKLYFDFDLSVQSVGTTTQFDQLVSGMQKRGELTTSINQEYFDRYADSLNYWNGTGWQHTPAINKAYLKARRSMKNPSYEKQPSLRPEKDLKAEKQPATRKKKDKAES